MSKKKEIVFVLVLIVLMIVFIEAALRLLGIAVPKAEFVIESGHIPMTIPDSHLGIRPNPQYPEHDEKGFRNENVPERAGIVALGDSQTYGMGVRKADAWPRQLSRITGKPVYNMAFGSYGPLHSLALFPEALSLKPRIIIEAFYTGNDLFDAFQSVYGGNSNREWRAMATKDEAVLRAIHRAENAETLLSKALEMTTKVHVETQDASTQKKTPDKRTFLSRHSRIVRVFELLFQKLSSRRSAQQSQIREDAPQAQPRGELFLPFKHGALQTVFNPSYRLMAVDRRDPRIQEGFRLCLEAMRMMAQSSRERGVQFAALLIPTKELAFKQAVHEAMGNSIDIQYQRLVIEEEQVLAEMKDYLYSLKIPVIDCRDALREALLSGPLPYRTSSDGHPAPFGYKAIAGEVAREISRLGLWEESGQ